MNSKKKKNQDKRLYETLDILHKGYTSLIYEIDNKFQLHITLDILHSISHAIDDDKFDELINECHILYANIYTILGYPFDKDNSSYAVICRMIISNFAKNLRLIVSILHEYLNGKDCVVGMNIPDSLVPIAHVFFEQDVETPSHYSFTIMRIGYVCEKLLECIEFINKIDSQLDSEAIKALSEKIDKHQKDS